MSDRGFDPTQNRTTLGASQSDILCRIECVGSRVQSDTKSYDTMYTIIPLFCVGSVVCISLYIRHKSACACVHTQSDILCGIWVVYAGGVVMWWGGGRSDTNRVPTHTLSIRPYVPDRVVNPTQNRAVMRTYSIRHFVSDRVVSPTQKHATTRTKSIRYFVSTRLG